MPQPDSGAIALQAERLYEEKWKAILEPTHHGEFLAIEPVSETYFFGRTLSDAIGSARKTFPDRRVYAIRIGYSSAFQIGAYPS